MQSFLIHISDRGIHFFDKANSYQLHFIDEKIKKPMSTEHMVFFAVFDIVSYKKKRDQHKRQIQGINIQRLKN